MIFDSKTSPGIMQIFFQEKDLNHNKHEFLKLYKALVTEVTLA